MKKYVIGLILVFSLSNVLAVLACSPFSFALLTDLHLSPTNPQAEEDLQNSVNEVNKNSEIEFVLVTGDITDAGDRLSLLNAKKCLDNLNKPYYIVPGNHELKWSESGATDFPEIFGDDKFSFSHKGYLFVGFTTGPVIKMGDGHVVPQDIKWIGNLLKHTEKKTPVFVVTHYPLQNGDVDNWYQITDVIRKYNVQAVLGGHYHRNVFLNYDGIPGIIHRSNLRGNNDVGGYSILSVSDSLRVYEKLIGKSKRIWITLPLENKHYPSPNSGLKPSFSVNQQYTNVQEIWRINTGTAIYTQPSANEKSAFFGDDNGFLQSISLKNASSKWKFKTAGRIISSPALKNNKVVFGSTDGNIYCLNADNGKLLWKFQTKKAVLGSPLIENDTVFIGGSDGCFRAFSLKNGQLLWQYCGIGNYVETRPVSKGNKIFFGAWDSFFYALNKTDGSLVWKWNNGSERMHLSPAAVIPVISGNKVFITAPDRYWTALDTETGKILWRTNLHEVRETLGISIDGKTIFSRCMHDSVVALNAQANAPEKLWKTNAGYGYDHNPSMLVEQDGTIVFGTKNGLLVGIDALNGAVLWKHKVGNSIINTVTFVTSHEFLITTTEGVVAKLKFSKK